MHHDANAYRNLAWLLFPVWLSVLVQLIGGWRFGKDTYSESYAVHLGPFYPLVSIVLAISAVSPLVVASGLVMLLSGWARAEGKRRVVPLLALLFSLVLSLFSCAWSCGGHPTWIGGYK